MKKSVILFFIAAASLSCKEKTMDNDAAVAPEIAQLESETLYGEDFMNVKTLSPDQVSDIYKNLSPGDTINATFRAPVKAVCKEKGCWMQVDVGGTDPVMVRFKDYGFFVPKNIEQKEVTVHGRAFIAEVGVEELRHLAEDAGKDRAAIAAINSPKRTLSFTADGVKITE